MRRLHIPPMLALAALCWVGFSVPQSRAGEKKERPIVREIFVPFEDLEALLEGQPRRVLLPRAEYEELLKKAVKDPERKAPLSVTLIGADYTVTAEEDRARLTGKLAVDVLEDGLFTVPLDLAGVGLRRATLDGKDAPIGRDDSGKLTLFVEGAGRHELELSMVSPLETTAARQQLSFRLPRAPSGQFQMTVPGDVEIKSGAGVISRKVDAAAGVTRFELVPPVGDATFVMTLNSRLARRQRAVVARSVIVDEVTEAYERLHVTVSLSILHQAVDRFRFVVPQGFEVTDVSSPQLARWAMEPADTRQVLDVRLREQTTDTVVLNLSAVRMAPDLNAWSLARLEPLDVVGQVAVVGLLVDQRMKAESIAASGLISIDTDVLRQAIPETVFQAEPGAPALKSVVAWYAPQPEFNVSARFTKPPERLAVTSNVLLVLDDQGHQARGGYLLQPEVDKLFAVDLTVPAGWKITGVTDPDRKPLAFERYAADDGAGRVHVKLPRGISPGEEYRIYFEAAATPAGWLANWESREVEFPVFAVSQAAVDTGAIAVEARDDMVARSKTLDRLTPLDEAEKDQYLGGTTTGLAYRYESRPYAATLAIARTKPRLTARTFSFIRVEPDVLSADYEIAYQVEEARTKQLSLTLPLDTPETLSIRGLDGVRLKEFVSEEVDGMRRWNVLLADPAQGRIRLAVHFEQPLEMENQQGHVLPIVRADGVAWQSGLVAVEGSAELIVGVSTDKRVRRVDVGELVDADYQPGRRLLGAFGFVGTPGDVKVDVSRHPAYALHKTIVQRAELLTRLSANGDSQTAAVFELRTKATFLEVQLPGGAELWSADLGGVPVKPQREGDKLLVSLPAGVGGAMVKLHLIYRIPIGSVGMSGSVQMAAPGLLLRADSDAPGVKVPMANLVWRLQPPPGHQVIDSSGTVVSTGEKPEPVFFAVAKTFLGSAVTSPLLLASSHRNWRAEVEGQMLPSAHYMDDDVQYFAPGADFGLARDKAGAAALQEYESRNGQFPGYVDMMIEGEKGAAAGERLRVLVDASNSLMEEKSEEEAGRPAEAPAAPPPPLAAEPAAPPQKPATDMPQAGRRRGEVRDGTSQTIAGAQVQQLGDMDDMLVLNGWQADVAGATRALRRTERLGAMQGLRSLLIDLEQGPGSTGEVSFESLGVAPQLRVTVASRTGLDAVSWAVAGMIGLWGLMRTGQTIASKVRFIVIVMLVGTLVPLFVGWDTAMGPANAAVYAALWLIPFYLAAGLLRCLGRCCLFCFSKTCCAPKATAAATILVIGCLVSVAGAVEPQAKDGSYVVQIVPPPEPVSVPTDAVILPYDPESKTGIQDADRMMVPYDKYVELWNLAHPDDKIDTKRLPAEFSLAGASYTATLVGEEFLLVEGRLEIEVFGDKPVIVPLKLAGGVLTTAELDGKPARLSVPQPIPEPKAQAQQQAAKPAASAAGSIVVLHVDKKGRHRLDVAVRMRLERRGGWRVAQGVLPSAAASELAVTVPQSHTEVRLGPVVDRKSYETKQAGQKIETALGPGGALGLEWRPKVAEGEVDHSLTADSTAVLDVQEDGLRLTWKLALEFRRSQRDTFQIQLPGDYLLEKVAGTNVRGWEIETAEGSQIVDVSLLKTAKDNEQFTLHLWKNGAIGSGDLARFDAPVVRVGNAALHGGRMTIRRSPMLDVRTESVSGATRADIAPSPPAANQPEKEPGAGTEESPLGIRPYQAYQFASTSYAIRLAASPVAAKTTATVRSILRVSQYERGLESRLNLHAEGRPVHQVDVLLPPDFELDDVSTPGQAEWALTTRDQRPQLTVYLAAGQGPDVPVIVTGKLPRQPLDEPFALPNLQVLDVDRQEGDLAVQVDPAFNVAAQDLKDCQNVLLSRVYGWLNPEQRGVTRLAINYRQADYSGRLLLSLRKPSVTCDTITNVKVTDRAIEETILLDFTVRNAGIREVSFILPSRMSDCRVEVPMLRLKTVEPSAESEGSIRVKLEFQDEVMGQLRVLVENDRLLEPAKDYSAPIPTVETGRTVRRYVAMESAGRDEVLVDAKKSPGLETLSRQQKEWAKLQAMLGEGITRAYLVASGAENPQLVFKTHQRTALVTAGAQIGLAETRLVFDSSGAYRAEQLYWIDNQTEQFLTVELPQGAQLWTAQLFTTEQWSAKESGRFVAGEPVKPTKAPNSQNPRLIQVPLVKTQAGDLDYIVRMTYGGQASSLATYGKVDFPLMHTENIKVALSQVRLVLPDSHRYDFDGTMRLVPDQEEALANRLAYQTKKVETLRQVLQDANPFAKARAANNLMQIGLAVHNYHDSYDHVRNDRLREEASKNSLVIEQAQSEVEELVESLGRDAQMDNRSRLRKQVEQQKGKRARNVVVQMGKNFDAAAVEQGQGPARFNSEWFDKSQLSNSIMAEKEVADAKGKAKVPPQAASRLVEGKKPAARYDRKVRGPGVSQAVAQPANQPAPAGQSSSARGRSMGQQAAPQPPQKKLDAVARYQQRHMQKQGGMAMRSVPTDAPALQPAPGNARGGVAGRGGMMGGMGMGMAEGEGREQAFGARPTQRDSVDQSFQVFGRRVDEANAVVAGDPFARPEQSVVVRGEVSSGMQVPGVFSADVAGDGITETLAHHDLRQAIRQAGGQPGAAAMPTGLASLDVEIPELGQSTVYLFTTPQGEVEISARALSNDKLKAFVQSILVLAAAMLVLFVVRLVRRGSFNWLIGRTGSTCLIVLGLLGFFVFPVISFLAIVIGTTAKIQRSATAAS